MAMMVKFFPISRADRQLALLLFAGTFGLYVRTLAPGLLFGDGGEFQVAAWHFGLAHPTGYPLYLILGGSWQHLLALFGLEPAYALNLLSALFGALTVTLLYLTMMVWLGSSLRVRRLAALLTALLLAVNPTFWSQSLIAEVYTLHACFMLLILHSAYQLMQAASITPSAAETTPSAAALVTRLGILLGLSLTHHAMTVLLLPSVLIALWWARRRWLGNGRAWLGLVLGITVPLLLYLYLPLRSGPAASPWYHQVLGEHTLTLYANNWHAFWSFISGASISVGFRTPAAAWVQLGQAWLLWRLHFLLPGLVLVVLGLYVLIRARNWRVLALTVPFVIGQQLFNLFYAIGDILVYYIGLYLVAAIWAGFVVDAVGGGMATMENQQAAAQPAEARSAPLAMSIVLALVLLWLPLDIGRTYFAQLDQSRSMRAEQLWSTIAAANPPPGALLVSNDRNEIVPLFYLQQVKGQFAGVAGLFPLLEPGERFADIGATIDTARALAPAAPLYLIKAMPSLAVKYALQEVTAPLVQVVGPAVTTAPRQRLDQPYGPLRLLGYDWVPTGDQLALTLYWQVESRLDQDYTTTVQIYDAAGNKLAQSDAPAGDPYYPTSLWKPGEQLVEHHLLTPNGSTPPTGLLIAMYHGPTFTQFAPPIEITPLPVGTAE